MANKNKQKKRGSRSTRQSTKRTRPPNKQAVKKHEAGDVASILQTAINLHQEEKLDEADKLYQQVLSDFPNDVTALHFRGLLLCHTGSTREGEQLMLKSIDLAPTYFDAHNNLANILQIQERYDEAISRYTICQQLKPNAAEPLINLGVIAASQSDDERAETLFLKSLEHEPENALAYNRLAKLKLKAREYEDALEYFDKALNYAEGRLLKSVLVSKSNLLLRLDRQSESIELYENWLKHAPGDEMATHMLAAISGKNTPDKPGEQYVKNLFDGFATSFDTVLEGLEYKAPQLIQAFIESRYPATGEAGHNVLDAGCGTGLCGHFLRPISKNLVGVDLSPGMLKQARVLDSYDDLIEDDLLSYLSDKKDVFDLLVSADTLCYFGKLDDFFALASSALCKERCLVFTVECEVGGDSDYRLHPHGRYSHTPDYVERSLTENGFGDITMENCELRMERGVPVEGLLVVAKTTG